MEDLLSRERPFWRRYHGAKLRPRPIGSIYPQHTSVYDAGKTPDYRLNLPRLNLPTPDVDELVRTAQEPELIPFDRNEVSREKGAS
jgi:hypothetical protein